VKENNDMFSDLIIGFDGSASARDALAFARRLALATGAHPTVLYVRPYTALSAKITVGARDLTWSAEVECVLDEARALMADVTGATFAGVAETSVARALHRAAEDTDAALIVLGATHRSRIGRVVPGPTANAVIHAAPCAVAIAPAGYADRAVHRPFGLIVAALDGGDETERVARIAGRIARRADAALRLVTVVRYTSGQYAGRLGYGPRMIDAMRDASTDTLDRATAAAGPDLDVERRVAEGVVADEVTRESDGADLLVIGSRAYGPLRRLALESQTGRILHAATSPVLVVPRRAAEQLDDAIVPLAAAGAQ
jgi:nucleotide-binding universal stress UspA family protein